jgi:hypothetical protein
MIAIMAASSAGVHRCVNPRLKHAGKHMICLTLSRRIITLRFSTQRERLQTSSVLSV